MKYRFELVMKNVFHLLPSECTNTVVIRLTSLIHLYFSGYLIMYWWKRTQGDEDMWSNSEYVNFVSLKVVFAEPKNKFKILSSISYSHYKPKKKKTFESISEFRQQICPWNLLIVLWDIEKITLLQSSFPINLNSFYVKLGNLLQRNQSSQLLVVDSVV